MSWNFDRVPHLHIAHKISFFGTIEHPLSWPSPYSAQTSRSVSTSVVVHGSVPDLLLFLLCINDALHLITHDVLLLYGDGTKIVHPLKLQKDSASARDIFAYVYFGRLLCLQHDDIFYRQQLDTYI